MTSRARKDKKEYTNNQETLHDIESRKHIVYYAVVGTNLLIRWSVINEINISVNKQPASLAQLVEWLLP